MKQRVAAVIIKDKKLLLVKGKEDFYFTLGGKVEKGETDFEALIRECQEELCIIPINPKLYLTYESMNQTTQELQEVRCYIIESIQGDIKADNEIKEIFWYSRENHANNSPKVATGVFKYLLPALTKDDII